MNAKKPCENYEIIPKFSRNINNMKPLFIKSSFIFIICFFSLIGLAKGQDFEVSPVKLYFSAEPGENQTKTISVKNHGNSKISMLVSLGDFVPSENGEKKMLPPNTTKRSCANWLNINPSFFDLNPGEERTISVTILVPTSESTSAWCMLYIQPAKEQTAFGADKTVSTGLMVTGRIAVQVFQTPKSNMNQLVKVYNLKEIPSDNDKVKKYAVTLDNLGEKINTCKVYLILSDIKTAEEKQYPPIEVETYPKSTRDVILELPSDIPPGQYALAAVVDYGSKNNLEGTQITVDIK